MRKTIPRCPKCGKEPWQYRETVTLEWFFEVENGQIVAQGEGDDAMHGPPVRAMCECGYEWILRGVFQITDLPLLEKED